MKLELFARYLQNKTLLGDLSTEPLIKLLTELEEKMPVCPICGSRRFKGVLKLEAEIQDVRTAGKRIVGVPGTPSITLELTCADCGATPEVKDLVERKICCVCGNPVQSMYYLHTDGAAAHPSCLESISSSWKRINED